MKKYLILATLLVSALLTGCQTMQEYDYTNLNASKPRSILVLPPINNTVEVTAPYSFLSTISRPLAEKGYYVFPVSVMDTFMKENGLPTPNDMHAIPIGKLFQHTHADAVLYVTIENWGQNYQVLASSTVVDSTAKLVDTKTGKTLWETEFHFVQTSDDAGGGLLGMVVNAIVTQIAGSVQDTTPHASRVANMLAINRDKNGLLPGPYAVAK